MLKTFLKETSLILRTKPLLAIALVCVLAACGNHRPFDSAAWHQGNLRVRGSMAEDLIKRKVLVGRPADDAQRLLGRPDKDYTSALVYKIDMGMPFKDPSRYAFVVHLDADRNVREVQITD
ncbi:MAG: hypothetical protein ND866_09045 [Pyrinomonadaceae bacterium]|nr:hypothetical protein [Pyrinomonadaceae bacterium]